MRKWLIAFLLALFWGTGAWAQSNGVNALDVSTACGTVGTAAALVLPAIGDSTGCITRNPATRTTVFLANASVSGGATVSCGYNSSITLNGIGTFTLGPLQSAFWPRGSAPHQAIWCIASSPATLMQVVIIL